MINFSRVISRSNDTVKCGRSRSHHRLITKSRESLMTPSTCNFTIVVDALSIQKVDEF